MSKALQFVTDADGNKTAVILPIEEYEELMEDLHLARVWRESKDEERIPFSEVIEELRSTGKIDV
jgi:hypothetical protein